MALFGNKTGLVYVSGLQKYTVYSISQERIGLFNV